MGLRSKEADSFEGSGSNGKAKKALSLNSDKGASMTNVLTLRPIGVVQSPRDEPLDDFWADVVSTIVLDETQFSPEALFELDTFSHLEVVFYMHKVQEHKIRRGARHPRNRKEWPEVGIFAQRAKGRPNQLGVSRCCILKVEGLSVTVSHLDAIDGTPVLDIKPFLQEMGPVGEVRQPAWSTELMKHYYASRQSE